MSEEKLKILDMLKEGKITADEAVALLKQVQDDDNRHRDYRHNWERPYYPHKPDFSWINSLCSVIEETSSNIGEAVWDAIKSNEPKFASMLENFTAFSNINAEINELVFEGKNAPVKLKAYDGDRLEVEAYYKAKFHWDPHITLCEENGVYSLRYDDNALYMLGINIRVPEKARIAGVCLKNRNAPIKADDISANNIDLNTKNASIKLSNVKGERLICESKNAPVSLDDVEAREIDAKTSNAKISLDDVESFRARLVTSNAKIEVKDSGVVQLYAKTSNSSLRLENFSINKQEPVSSIEAITSNGQISLQLPSGELNCKLRASTTFGGISIGIDNLEYQVKGKNYVEAQTRGYETARNKLNLNLQTTNSGIYLK